MDLHLNLSLTQGFTSSAQKARIMTEAWALAYIYCPRCGHEPLYQYPNNQPVADFYCENCHGDYELKSKQGMPGQKLADGAYETMIRRIGSDQNPDFFLLTYGKTYEVERMTVIPKHFFVPELIEKRQALSPNARRAGWVGCNILLSHIPEEGKIDLLKDGQFIPKEKVMVRLRQTTFLAQENLESRGWLMDILLCMNRIQGKSFSLEQMYAFERILQQKHPANHHIKDKIRQQLQILRDKGLIDFMERGIYQKKE